ncbi:MAG: pyridoxamine 5'-phosphate oxidase family protein [Cytophagales bacterium]|nr:pyridoxamine 5'-phosphate oxidase family protein [Cytophagales bacterium]
MKSLIKFPCLTILILLFVPFKVVGQNELANDSSRIGLISAAREIMTKAGTCALITLDEEGRPRVRVMDPFLPESDLTVWFGTNPKSRKVNQIKNDPRVTLYYLDNSESGYVMIHGVAQLVDDPLEKKVRWKEEWTAFYPNKSENYLLIKVSPSWMELVSYRHGILGDTVTWQPPKVIFDNKQ